MARDINPYKERIKQMIEDMLLLIEGLPPNYRVKIKSRLIELYEAVSRS